jgi:hypothetical protein
MSLGTVNNGGKVSKLVLGKENDERKSCYGKRGGSIMRFVWERGY